MFIFGYMYTHIYVYIYITLHRYTFMYTYIYIPEMQPLPSKIIYRSGGIGNTAGRAVVAVHAGRGAETWRCSSSF